MAKEQSGRKNARSNVAGTVWELVTPTAEEQGLTVWDVAYVREGSTWYLRITIDRPEGISLDECEKFHRAIDPLLDEADPIEDAYMLEVSSPGVERELKYPWHFAACTDNDVLLRFYAPMEEFGGGKQLRGLLTAYDEAEDTLTVRVGDTDYVIPREKIAAANIAFDF